MKISEIVSFMNPAGDALSLTFVSILVVLTIFTMVWVARFANEQNWQKNWYGEDLDNSSDSEYSSINELSEAAATKAERVADIMPSMLLILGLLGTFIGLGIALNSASNALATVGNSNIDGAMTQLMSLMDGLGAKFKTSTWGILCFIVLNLFLNSRGYGEKRLAWAIKKIRQQSHANKIKQGEEESDKLNKLLSGFKLVTEENHANHQLLLDTITKENQATIQALIHTNQLTIDTHRKVIEQNIESLIDVQREMVKHNIDNQNAHYLKNSQSNGEFQRAMQNYFTNAIKSLQANQLASEFMQTKSEENLGELKKIAEYNLATQKSMQDFVTNTVDSMKSIGKSADKMSGAAKEVGLSANSLNDVIHNLRTELEGVMKMIKQDLGSTIENMGESFEKNMDDMSTTMSKATQGISTAVGDLTVNVGKTMSDVTGAITESMNMQTRSANEFTVASSTLNTYIEEMKNLITQLSGNITSGLKAVSENGRRMESANKRFELSSELVTSMININQELNKHIEEIANMKDLITQFSENITSGLKAVSENGRRMESANKRFELSSELVTNMINTNQEISNHIEKIANINNQSMSTLFQSLNEKNIIMNNLITQLKTLANKKSTETNIHEE